MYKNIVSNNKTDAVAVEEKKNVGRELQKNSILNPLMVIYH
jgi:hypothetical protein